MSVTAQKTRRKTEQGTYHKSTRKKTWRFLVTKKTKIASYSNQNTVRLNPDFNPYHPPLARYYTERFYQI